MQTTVVITHLELRSREQFRPAGPARIEHRLERVAIACPEFNRCLYTAVGAGWTWHGRLGWSYARWLAWLDRPELETWVAFVSGSPAGYFELEHQPDRNAEIVYFGVLPRFIGQGLGGALLNAAVRRAWDAGAERVWLHTCSLDHPGALPNYLARGFEAFRIEERLEQLPDAPLEPWPGANRSGTILP